MPDILIDLNFTEGVTVVGLFSTYRTKETTTMLAMFGLLKILPQKEI